MDTNTVKEGKTIAIISYITIIGFIIAFIMNKSKNNFFASFHIRQALGIGVLNLVLSLVSGYLNQGMIGNLLGLAVWVLAIIGIIAAVQGEEKKIPLLGDQFQEWFKSIS